MQWWYNLTYYGLDYGFSLLPAFPAFSFINDFLLAFGKYASIANYYLPIDTLIAGLALVLTVSLICFLIHLIVH